jgi:NADPH-dependent ferric siderophore reductase
MARTNVAFTVPVTVESVRRLSPGFSRIAVTGDGLGQYTRQEPADAFKLMFPPDGSRRIDYPRRGPDNIPYWPEGTTQPLLRAFTVRAFDRARSRLEFDVALHASGMFVDWLRAGPVGCEVALSGMRREFAPGLDVGCYVFAGDASALPAIAAIVETLDAPVVCYLQVPDEADRALLPRQDVRWVDDLAAGLPDQPPPGRVQVWLAAEAAAVRAVRRHVIDRWGVDRDDLHASAYWRAGHDATRFDAVNLVRYQEAAGQGLDITDPDVREELELRV